MPKLALCLVIAELGGGHVDAGLPGWLGGQVGGGERPDQGLPGWSGPVDPGYGQGGGPAHPWFPGHGRPDRPSQGLPGYGRPGGPRPDQGLPAHPIYRPEQPIAPGTSPKKGLWVVAYLAGKGFVWTPISPSLPEQGLPTPPAPGQELPEVPPTETAEPKPA